MTEDGALLVTLRGELEGYAVEKRFTIEPESLFTIPVEIEVRPRADAVGEVEPGTIKMTFSNYIPNANSG